MDESSPKVECEVCGGQEYYKEAGHYYCQECQTQTQELQEHVFEQDIGTVNKKSTKRVTKPNKDKAEDKVTSWECYNVILLALTEELIELGASSSLKPVVKCLWMKYLNLIGVFNLKNDNVPPMFDTITSKRDIRLLYGTKKRPRRRSSSESASTSIKSVSDRRNRSRKKRALALSQQDELSQKSAQESSSLHNETLGSLKSEESSTSLTPKITFNTLSRKTLLKKMCSRHLLKHQKDVEMKLKCHQYKLKDFGKSFQKSPSRLNVTKLYTILYLGLLIIKDKIQLGDFLRFIKEGHLSFQSFTHMFSEEYENKKLIMPQPNVYLFSSLILRQNTIDLAKYLKVTAYIEVPNLIDLSFRFCKELNLPDEIHKCVEKLILVSLPQLRVTKHSIIIPNYEGRVMSFIIFTLKLLFGLDGVTEHKFADYASLLNRRNLNIKMFNIVDWLKYIGYRDVVVSKYHLPTAFQKQSDNVDSEVFLEYVESHNLNFKTKREKELQKEFRDYLQVLKELKEMQLETEITMEFIPSLTPFSNYTDIILKYKTIEQRHVLEQNFANDSLDFLLRPNKFLKLVNNKVIKNSGANENIVFQGIKNPPSNNKIMSTAKNRCVKIQINKNGGDHLLEKLLPRKSKDFIEKPIAKKSTKKFLLDWQNMRKHRFLLNKMKLETASDSVKIGKENNSLESEENSYEEHYHPFERFWMGIHSHISYFNPNERDEYINQLPHSFNTILNECSRITEQCKFYLLEEYNLTEAYLAYVESYKKNTRSVNSVIKGQLVNIVRQAQENW